MYLVYHSKCLANLYNRDTACKKDRPTHEESKSDDPVHLKVFAELVCTIQGNLDKGDVSCV